MEQDPDSDTPDQDTELLAAMRPAAPARSPTTSPGGGEALEDAETVPLAVAVGDPSTADTMQLATCSPPRPIPDGYCPVGYRGSCVDTSLGWTR